MRSAVPQSPKPLSPEVSVMQHRSRAAVEAAALKGITSSPNTEACASIFRAAVGCDFIEQGDNCSTSINTCMPHASLTVLSLSSSPPSHDVYNLNIAPSDRLQQDRQATQDLADGDTHELVNSSKGTKVQQSPPPREPLNAFLGAASSALQRDRKGRLRLVSADGQVEVRPASRRMEAFNCPSHDSCGSNMSATQENDPSVYARFKLNSGDGIRPASSSPDLTGNALTRDPASNVQPPTTGSGTEVSYKPYDTGHLTLDYQPPPLIPFPDSVDGAVAHATPITQTRSNKSDMDFLDPQTPGQSRLFVGRPGTVLRPSQMFAETQPSPGSRSRYITLPSSNRPSPDLFPQNQLPKDLASSPLVRRAANKLSGNVYSHVSSSPEHHEKDLNVAKLIHDRSPLSNRSDLVNGKGESYTTASLLYQNIHQPFDVYKSRKESQDRRRHASVSDNASQSSDDGFSDGEMERNTRAKMEKTKAAKQLSTLMLSRPSSSESEIVEVPSTSTGRRRSLAEDYEAQCSGFDARDSQPDDTIADSQSAPTVPNHFLIGATNEVLSGSMENDSFSNTFLSRDTNSSENPSQSKSTGQLPDLKDLRRSQEELTNQDNFESQTRPVHEFSTNIAELRTPAVQRRPDIVDGDAMVPETSPAEAHLQRYGAIVSQSSVLSSPEDIEIHNPFSQAVEFNKLFHSTSPQHRTASRTVELSNSSSTVNIEASLIAAKDQISPNVNQSLENLSSEGKSSKAKSTVVSTGDYVTAPTHLSGEHSIQDGVDSTSIVDDSRARESLNGETTIEDLSCDSGVHKVAQGVAGAQLHKSETIKKLNSVSTKNCRESKETRFNNDGTEVNSTTSRTVAKDMAVASAKKLQTNFHPPLSPRSRIYKRQRQQNTQISADSNSLAGANDSDLPELLPRSRSAVQLRRSSRLLSKADEDSNEVQNPTSPMRVAGVSTKKSLRSRQASVVSNENGESSELEFPTSPLLPKLRRSSTVRLEDVGLFQNMAFSVTYPTEQDAEREEVVHLILQHGGRILTKGFDELFETMHFQLTGSFKSPEGENTSEGSDLTLTAEARGTGFACLIADRHSRRVKFMQALALGLPCVSGCWIKHCAAKGEILDWDQYLLAAGESSFLGGAVRNRNLKPYPASTASFEEHFNMRPKLLTGKAVLLITGKGKVEELRRPYFFLTRVLGARSVKRVHNTQEARRVLLDSETHAQQWDWVYVDKNKEDAEKAIFGPSVASAGKRKRGASEGDASNGPPKKIKLVDDEYVIQSLILGKFIAEN